MKLKVNFQKISAVVISVSVLISSFLIFPVSADSKTPMTNQEYYAAQSYLIAKYKDGEISYSEYQQRSQAVTDEFVANNTIGGVLQSGALNASNTVNAVSQKIGSTVQKYGDNARDYISDYVSDFFNDYTVLNEKPTTDLKGGVAIVKIKNSDGSYYAYYGNVPGELSHSSSATIAYLATYRDEFYDSRGNLIYCNDRNSSISFDYSPGGNYFLYGNWKWKEDGSQAPTDDTYETISDYDFSQVPERELEDLLKKVLDEFELKQPDLSSIEGLLKAIYARLGTLDSDDDASTLSLINSAINTLVAENKESNKKIIEKLEDFKIEIDTEKLKETLKEWIPDIDDMTGTEKLYSLFISKFSFVEEMKSFINRFMSYYARSSSNKPIIHVEFYSDDFLISALGYDIDLSGGGLFDEYMPIIRYIIASFIYLSYAFNTYKKMPLYISCGGD